MTLESALLNNPHTRYTNDITRMQIYFSSNRSKWMVRKLFPDKDKVTDTEEFEKFKKAWDVFVSGDINASKG